MEIRTGSRVTCHGGWIGEVLGIVVDPDSHLASYVVIGGAGLEDRPALLQWAAVGAVSPEHVHLPISTTTLREMPRASGRSLPSYISGRLLDAHTPAMVEDQRGRVCGFAISDPEKRLERVLVARGTWPFRRTVAFPAESLRLLPSGKLVVRQPILLPEGGVDGSDKQLEERLAAMLEDQEPFKNSSRFSIRIAVEDGRVRLSGNVRFPDDQRQAEEHFRSLSGTRKVSNILVADTDIEAKLAQLLAHDPRTSHLKLRVSSFLGRVTVTVRDSGELPRAAIEETARCVSGVVSVSVEAEESPTPWSYTVVPKKTYTPVTPASHREERGSE